MIFLLAPLVLFTNLGAPCLAPETWDGPAGILCNIQRELAMGVIPPQQPSPEPAPKTPFAGLIFEYLRRDATGHSPTPEEIAAMASLQPAPDAASVREAMPLFVKALDNPDIPLHTFALTALVGLQVQPPAPPEPPAAPAVDPNTLPAPTAPPPAPPPPDPAAYPAETAKAIAPYIPQIAAHLTSEDAQSNRLLAATILGGFIPDAPVSIYAPLLAFLKRDDAIGPVGLAVVTDLVQLGPISADTAAAITRFLRRSDQTGDSRANLADLLATGKNQSQAVNKTLLVYLRSDDNSLRARIILSLPQLDLDPQDYADTKSRLDRIAGDPGENLQVVTAAKHVAPCWTAIKMASGCPIY